MLRLKENELMMNRRDVAALTLVARLLHEPNDPPVVEDDSVDVQRLVNAQPESHVGHNHQCTPVGFP